MSKFATDCADDVISFDSGESEFSTAYRKLHNDFPGQSNTSDPAQIECLELRRKLAHTQNLLKAADAAKAEMLGLLSSISKIGEGGQGHRSLEEVENEADRYLSVLRRAFGKIAKYDLGNTDVFVNHLLGEIENLATVATEAAAKGKLRVTAYRFNSARQILDAFGTSERSLRYTWRINPTQRLFADLDWRNHFKLTASLVNSQAIKEIRTLFIFEDENHLDIPHIKKLLEYFSTQRNLTAKFIMSADYDAFLMDHAISETCVDFGIYGDRLLIQDDSYTPVTVGSWSKDSIEIQRFTTLFDMLWNRHNAVKNNPLSPAHRISIAELMKADDSVQ